MPEARGVTIRELWAQTAEVIGARNEARWLCEVATALNGDDFVVALDEPVSWLFEDPRVVNTTEVFDEIWLRLVDVPRMLQARTYGVADPVVIEVRDKLLPANDGRYRVSPQIAAALKAVPGVVEVVSG